MDEHKYNAMKNGSHIPSIKVGPRRTLLLKKVSHGIYVAIKLYRPREKMDMYEV
jgi:hypothetical protein